MKLLRTFLILSLLAVAALPTVQLFADSSSATAKVSFRILPYQKLSISSGRSAGNTAMSSVRIAQPDLNDLSRGYIEQRNAIQLEVQSNIPWLVRVRTDDGNMGRSFDGTYTKPVSDFQVRLEGGRYFSLSNSDQLLHQGDQGVYQFNIDYKTLFNKQSYSNGNYQIKVLYTIVSR